MAVGQVTWIVQDLLAPTDSVSHLDVCKIYEAMVHIPAHTGQPLILRRHFLHFAHFNTPVPTIIVLVLNLTPMQCPS